MISGSVVFFLFLSCFFFFFFQAEDGIRDADVTGVQTCALPISLLFEAIRFFHYVPWYEFLFGLDWSPQTAIHADQVGQSGSFGAVPVFVGTAVITVIAMMVSVPVGLFSAIYLAEFADRRVRATVKPVLEILAGIPT